MCGKDSVLTKRVLEAVSVPSNYPCATFFVDESAARASAGSFFVVGAVKVRKPGLLLREIEDIRNKFDYDGELKFSEISRGKLTTYFSVIDALASSDAHITAFVVDRSQATNPFQCDDPEWLVHARITAKLLVGSLNTRELASAVIDKRSTPAGVAFDDTVRSIANQRLRSVGLVSAVCADSRCNDGLQLADLVAGAVAHQRRVPDPVRMSHKGHVAARLAAAFGVQSFAEDRRVDRVNVHTHGVDNRSKRAGSRRLTQRDRDKPVIELLRGAR